MMNDIVNESIVWIKSPTLVRWTKYIAVVGSVFRWYWWFGLNEEHANYKLTAPTCYRKLLHNGLLPGTTNLRLLTSKIRYVKIHK